MANCATVSAAMAVCSMIDFAVDGEKCARPAIQPIMFPQCGIEFFRVALHHGFVYERADASFRGGADKHAANDRPGMGDAFENHDAVLEVRVGQADRLAEPLHQTRMRMIPR